MSKKQVVFEDTLAFFPPHIHSTLIYAVEPLMESIRSLFQFADQFGVKISYGIEVALHLRFYANHLFKMAWIVNSIIDHYPGLTLYFFSSSIVKNTAMIDDQERFLGEIAERFCRQRNIPFVALAGHEKSSTSPLRVSRVWDKACGFFSDVLARIIFSTLQREKVIFTPPLGQSFNKVEKILKPHNPTYVVLTRKSYNVKSLLWNFVSLARLFVRWRPVRFFIPTRPRKSLVPSFPGRAEMTSALDQALQSLPDGVCMLFGISLKSILIKKARAGLFPHMEALVMQAERVDQYMAFCKRSIFLSHVGVDLYGVVGELFSLSNKPSLFISHGSHPVPSSPPYEVELLNLCRGFMLGVFPVVALATPVQEAHFNYFKEKYDFVRGVGLRTGPLIFVDLDGNKIKKARRNLGLADDDFVVVHASTIKNRSGERYLFIETLDEFFIGVRDMLEAVGRLDHARYVLRLHPGFILNDDEIRNRLGNPSHLIIHREGPFSQVLACADVVVSYSSTVIDESLINGIPVLLYDRWSRYNHFNTPEFTKNVAETDGPFFPVCYVTETPLLPKALDYLRQAKRNKTPIGDKSFEPYKYTKDYSANISHFVRGALEN
ncbi:MAG: hypothetical protein IPN90_01375 [Elusimicrobia bacterium]|nr:hypothetical protein [Elusimicrobiota bacterium]